MPPYNPIVLVDATVWHSRTLRDWIGLLYTQGDTAPFRVRWTEDILAEVLYHLRKQHPDWDGGRISSVREHIVATFETGHVRDFPSDDGYLGTDPHDRHVHSAAVACRADMIVTFNTRDFPDADDAPYEAVHPDEFLLLVDDVAPNLVDEATLASLAYWLGRRSDVDLPSQLRSSACPEFAERVRQHLVRLAPEISKLSQGG